MKDSAIYFPYINVPSDLWFTRVLLYWDSVSTITPPRYLHNPENLDDFNRELLQAGLIRQTFPGEHIWRIPNFNDAFIELVSQPRDLARRRKQFKSKAVRIHIQKLDRLGRELTRLEIAKRDDNDWYWVENSTANDFMCYLATSLGRLPDVDSMPITDQSAPIRRLVSLSPGDYAMREEVTRYRYLVLENALPAPGHRVNPWSLIRFKEKHGDMLRRFRREVEIAITDLSAIADPAAREHALDLLQSKIDEESAEIVEQIKANDWSLVRLGKWCAIAGDLPVVGFVPKILNAVIAAFGGTTPMIDVRSPWAYSAFTRRRILGRSEKEIAAEP